MSVRSARQAGRSAATIARCRAGGWPRSRCPDREPPRRAARSRHRAVPRRPPRGVRPRPARPRRSAWPPRPRRVPPRRRDAASAPGGTTMKSPQARRRARRPWRRPTWSPCDGGGRGGAGLPMPSAAGRRSRDPRASDRGPPRGLRRSRTGRRASSRGRWPRWWRAPGHRRAHTPEAPPRPRRRWTVPLHHPPGAPPRGRARRSGRTAAGLRSVRAGPGRARRRRCGRPRCPSRRAAAPGSCTAASRRDRRPRWRTTPCRRQPPLPTPARRRSRSRATSRPRPREGCRA